MQFVNLDLYIIIYNIRNCDGFITLNQFFQLIHTFPNLWTPIYEIKINIINKIFEYNQFMRIIIRRLNKDNIPMKGGCIDKIKSLFKKNDLVVVENKNAFINCFTHFIKLYNPNYKYSQEAISSKSYFSSDKFPTIIISVDTLYRNYKCKESIRKEKESSTLMRSAIIQTDFKKNNSILKSPTINDRIYSYSPGTNSIRNRITSGDFSI